MTSPSVPAAVPTAGILSRQSTPDLRRPTAFLSFLVETVQNRGSAIRYSMALIVDWSQGSTFFR